jgi:hypothetical protein
MIRYDTVIGPLSLECMHLGIRKVFYRTCANYEILNFERNLEEAFERSVQAGNSFSCSGEKDGFRL